MKIDEHPRLDEALARYAGAQEALRQEIEEDLWTLFGETSAVLVTDMANFSRVTDEEGIVYYLTLIQTMQRQVEALLPSYQGRLIKFLADNAFCLFPSVTNAIEFCQDLNARVHLHNVSTDSKWDIQLCSGICYGAVLNINHTDLFGAAVNSAARLGEDLAGPGDILLSQPASDQVKGSAAMLDARRLQAPEEDMPVYWQLSSSKPVR